MDAIFTTARALVRPFTMADVPHTRAFYDDPEVMRFMGTGDRWWRDDDPGHAVRRHREAYVKHPGHGFWAVVHDHEVIGHAVLKELYTTGDIEVGWLLRRDRWGLGLATELGHALLTYGFDRLGLARIVAVARPENRASIRVMQKIGMEPTGLRHVYGVVAQGYAITASDRRRAEAATSSSTKADAS